MSVNLNGFENVPREERKVLSQEQFNEYINSVATSYSDAINYYIVAEAMQRGNANFESVYEDYGISTKKNWPKFLKKK